MHIERLEPRRLLALITPTILDPTFGYRGVLATHENSISNDPIAFSTSYDTTAAALLPDGRIAQIYHTYSFDNAAQEASNSYNFELFDPATGVGTLFDTSDERLPALTSAQVAVQSDGKVILAGLRGGDTIVVARFVAPDEPDTVGGLDPTFGDGGVASATFAFDAPIVPGDLRVAIDAAGRAVVVMAFQGATGNRLAIARFKSDGSNDTNFSGDGKSISPAFDAKPKLITIASDDRIILAGDDLIGDDDQPYLRRLNPDGSPDTTFSGDGVAEVTIEGFAVELDTVTVKPDNGIIIGGTSFTPSDDGDTSSPELQRFTADGVVEPFPEGTLDVLRINGWKPSAVFVTPSGKIVVLSDGGPFSNSPDADVTRYNADGSVDYTAPFNGRINYPGTLPSGALPALLLDEDRLLYFAGGTAYARVAPRPTAPVTVGENGALVITLGDANDTVVVTQTDNATAVTINGQTTAYPRQFVLADVVTGAGGDAITLPRDLVLGVDTGAGDDSLTVSPLVEMNQSMPERADLIATGDGDDTLSFRSEFAEADLVEQDLIDLGGGNDRLTIVSSADPHHIDAGAGNDSLQLAGGPDSVEGGDGDDTLRAGDGNGTEHTTLNGEAGDDLLVAGKWAATLSGSDGDDTLIGGENGDSLDGGDGANSLVGNEGNDSLFSFGDDTTLIGNDGNDNLNADGDHTFVDGGVGDDSIGCGGERTTSCTAIGGTGNDNLLIGTDNAGGAAVSLAASVSGGEGDDVIALLAPLGIDTVDCGDGDDIVRALAAAFIIGGPGDDLLRVASAAGTSATVHGNDGDDSIHAADGRDLLYGDAGRDRIYGGAGSDLLSGGGGNDRLFGQGGDDRLYGGAGDDRLFGGKADDRLTGGAGADTMDGQASSDTVLDEEDRDLLVSVEIVN